MPAPTGVMSTIGTFQSPPLAQYVLPAIFSRSIVLNA
jgi:hypothetical protein